MINITIDNDRELLWLRTILDIGTLNVRPEYYKELMSKYGLEKTYTVNFNKSENYIQYNQPKEDNIMPNVKTDKFDFLEEIKREGFTQKYTKVYATSEKSFNAFHNYVVANAEAITHLMEAIESLRARTNKRAAQGIEGTSAIGGCDSCSIPPITE